MSNINDEDKKYTKDVMDAIIVYENDAKSSEKFTDKHDLGGVIYTPGTGSANDQSDELKDVILNGEDKSLTTKRISEILQSGDPLTESRTVMIVLARRELTKLLDLIDAIDRLESVLLDRVSSGTYDASQTYEIDAVLRRLEQSMSRSITIVHKVLDDRDYEEFLLAYRDAVGDDDESKLNGQIGRVGNDRDSRAKIRQAFLMIRDTLTQYKPKHT